METKDITELFDIYCRKVLKNKQIDYYRTEASRKKWEASFDGASEEVENPQALDDYFVKKLRVDGYEMEIKDDDLWEHLINLRPQELHIILSYALGCSDYQISEELDMPRRTVSAKRNRILELLRKELERSRDFEKSE